MVGSRFRDGRQLVGTQGCASGRRARVLFGISLGPLIVIAISIAGLAFGQAAVQSEVTGAIRGLLGDTGSQAVEAMLKGSDRPREAASFAAISVLFAMMFKWMPDTRIEWRDVWLGAILTAALFELGKFVIGFYIGKQGLESTYGAAVSIVVVLIWIYYSAQLVLMGAEFSQVYARRYGSRRAAGARRGDAPERSVATRGE
jgi:YihY family inner membrane protein